MTVEELAQTFSLECLVAGEITRQVQSCYIGDLLSRVMGQAPAGCVWITIMTNSNVCAVATLADVACIVLAEGEQPDAALLDAAMAHGVGLYRSDRSAYMLAAAFAAGGI